MTTPTAAFNIVCNKMKFCATKFPKLLTATFVFNLISLICLITSFSIIGSAVSTVVFIPAAIAIAAPAIFIWLIATIIGAILGIVGMIKSWPQWKNCFLLNLIYTLIILLVIIISSSMNAKDISEAVVPPTQEIEGFQF